MSNIEWCTKTWPLMYGCTKVSAGCDLCYASHRWVKRFQANPKLPDLYNKGIVDDDGEWTGKIVMLDRNLDWPLRIKKPERIFVNPFSDLFHEAVPHEFIARVFATMALAEDHRYMILTKRPLLMKIWFKWIADQWKQLGEQDCIPVDANVVYQFMCGTKLLNDKLEMVEDTVPPLWPLPNLALGVSVENPKHLDRLDYLRKTPAAFRFVSLEPLIAAIPEVDLTAIDWVIVGAESGKGARPMEVEWVRSIVEQCRAAGVAVFVKQLCHDGHKIPFSDFPEDLQVREIPERMMV